MILDYNYLRSEENAKSYIADTLNNIGLVYYNQGKFEIAINYFTGQLFKVLLIIVKQTVINLSVKKTGLFLP